MHSRAPEMNESSSPPEAKQRILVVDDERGPRESLRMLLKDEYDITLAECGEDGVARMKRGAFDLVLLDLKMKKMTGIEALEQIKAIDPVVSVVILTGYGTLETAQKAIRLGASDYVSKPFDVGELTATIKKILSKRHDDVDKGSTLDKLKTLNRTLEEEIGSFKKLLSSQKLYSSFFHEICNPLTSILGYVQILLLELEKKKGFGREDRDRAQKYLKIIENELDRCRLMFRSFSALAKSAKEEKEPATLKSALAETITLLKAQMDLKGVTIKEEIDPGTNNIYIDDTKLKQVLLNLCINSLHAMEKGGILRISASVSPGNEGVIEISDTGCGMDEETLRRAFQPFFTTKDPGVGTGLGLSISKSIVEKMGGSMKINSRKAEGTKVIITFPARLSPQTEDKSLS